MYLSYNNSHSDSQWNPIQSKVTTTPFLNSQSETVLLVFSLVESFNKFQASTILSLILVIIGKN